MSYNKVTPYAKGLIDDVDAAAARTTIAAAGTAETPRYIKYSAGWAARPADSRMTIYVGGSAATNAPVDANLANGDLWFPATA